LHNVTIALGLAINLGLGDLQTGGGSLSFDPDKRWLAFQTVPTALELTLGVIIRVVTLAAIRTALGFARKAAGIVTEGIPRRVPEGLPGEP
jgi:hypothetical protein